MKNDTLKNEIEDVIEDCRMFGIDKHCYVYVLKNGMYSGYSLEKEHVIYLDEDVIEVELFTLLVLLIELDFKLQKVNYSRKMIITRAIWNLNGVSLKKLSEKSNVPLRTLESWNTGTRIPTIEGLLGYAKGLGLPTVTIFNAINEEEDLFIW